MAAFLMTIRREDELRRYFIDGKRVSRDVYYETGDRLKTADCFHTAVTDTHIKHHHERR